MQDEPVVPARVDRLHALCVHTLCNSATTGSRLQSEITGSYHRPNDPVFSPMHGPCQLISTYQRYCHSQTIMILKLKVAETVVEAPPLKTSPVQPSSIPVEHLTNTDPPAKELQHYSRSTKRKKFSETHELSCISVTL